MQLQAQFDEEERQWAQQQQQQQQAQPHQPVSFLVQHSSGLPAMRILPSFANQYDLTEEQLWALQQQGLVVQGSSSRHLHR